MGIEDYFVEKPELCSLCKGMCCKSYPGMYLDPYRFEKIYGFKRDFVELLHENFLTFKICLGVPIPIPKFTDSGCVFLREHGCSLGREKRPCECLILIPEEETLVEGEILCKHNPAVSYIECFKRWKEYYIARSVYLEFGDI